MKNLIFLGLVAFLASCNTPTENAEISEKAQNDITNSDIYKKYEMAYNDYAACKRERPQLTQDFMDKKLTQKEFAEALEHNARSCNIKREIFNKYYQLLENEYDKAAVEYKIMED